MPPVRRAARLAALVVPLALAACGSGGGGGAAPTTSPSPSPSPSPAVEFEVVSGGAACGAGGCGGDSADGTGVGVGADGGDGAGGGLGEMRNVRVSVTKPDGSVLGSATLKDNLVSLFPGTYKGPVVLTFADDGSGNGQYFDEALNAWVGLGSATLHVMVPALVHHVSANVLTEAAYQYAKNGRFSEQPFADVMPVANAAVLDAFNARVPAAWRISDITNYAVAVSDTTVPNSLQNTHAGRHSTLMAALAIQALDFDASLPAPALAAGVQLAADMFDDAVFNASSVPQTAYGFELPQSLAVALATARSQYGAPTQPAVPSQVAPLCFNPALYAVGANVFLQFIVTDAQGSGVLETETVATTRLTSFQGLANQLERVDTVTRAGSTAVTTTSYVDPDTSAGILNAGNVTTFSGGSTLTVYSPPYIDRTPLLDPVNDFSSALVKGSGTVTGFDAAGNVTSGPSPTDVTYLSFLAGFETVTTATGQPINACVYLTEDVTSAQVLRKDWITTSGQGLLVQQQSFDASGVLTSSRILRAGSLNGDPVR